MSLLDIDDLGATVDEIARVVRPGGHLCVALVHPFSSAQDAETMGLHHSVVTESYLAERRYDAHMERDGLEMTFTSMHRSLSCYLGAFFSAGFVAEALREFGAKAIPWLLTLRLLRLEEPADAALVDPAARRADVAEPRSTAWRARRPDGSQEQRSGGR